MKAVSIFALGAIMLWSCGKENTESSATEIHETSQNKSYKLEYKVFNAPGETVQFGANYIYDGNLFKLAVSEATNEIIYTTNGGRVSNFKFTETEKFLESLSDFERDAFIQTFKRVATTEPSSNFPDPTLANGTNVYNGEDDIIITEARCQVVSTNKKGAQAIYSTGLKEDNFNKKVKCIESNLGAGWITICDGEC